MKGNISKEYFKKNLKKPLIATKPIFTLAPVEWDIVLPDGEKINISCVNNESVTIPK